jgi:nicotinic acid mononucleotide adenylyltransferase
VRIGTSPKRMIFVVTISDKRASRTVNRLIHRSARKGNSPKFAFISGSQKFAKDAPYGPCD